jgi:hypothetical protein
VREGVTRVLVMIIEKRTYVLYPGRVPEYLRLYEEEGLAIQEPVLGNLIGYFATEIGTQNEVMHLWGYEDHAERDRRRAELMALPEWQDYLAKILPMIMTMENAILRGANFSPIR